MSNISKSQQALLNLEKAANSYQPLTLTIAEVQELWQGVCNNIKDYVQQIQDLENIISNSPTTEDVYNALRSR